MKKIDKDVFVNTIKNSSSMASACSKLGMHFNTFKKYATQFGVYNPNQSGKGIHKQKECEIPLKDILNGEYPSYHRGSLKRRLLKEGIKKNLCEKCGQGPKWKGRTLILQLHHKDGNGRNHLLKNIEFLCPNCHSQTDTYCAKNGGGGTGMII